MTGRQTARPVMLANRGRVDEPGEVRTGSGRDSRVEIDLRWCGSEFVAALSDYPLLTESGRTPWDAVHRLIARHRGLLERRWGS